MKLSPKFILAFVLLMLSFSMGGNAMNFSAYASNCEASCQLSESSSDVNRNSSVDNQSVSYDNSQSLTISDVELGFKLVTESFYSDKDPHYSITCSDYYVFALRHILI